MGWRWTGGKTTGRSHLKSGLPCQDRFGIRLLPDGTLVAALADGAGSASRGEVGAETAVLTVLSRFQEALATGDGDLNDVLPRVAEQARDAVYDVAEQQHTDPRQYASTLLAVVLTDRSGAAMQIGDGVIVVKQEPEDWSWLIWPQRGEYANTTFFLTDPTFQQRLDVQTFPGPITNVALMSDGLESLALRYSEQTVHQPFFNGMFRSLWQTPGEEEIKPLSDSLLHFLSSDQVGSRTDDDVSIILATRRPASSAP